MKIPVFLDLPSYVVEIFLKSTEQKSHQKNSILYKTGDPSDYIYFVKEGQIEVFIKNSKIFFIIFKHKISEEIEVYNMEEYAADFEAVSMEEAQKLSATLRNSEVNSFNSSFMKKQNKKLHEKIRVFSSQKFI